MKQKILFVIPSLGNGGAEKVMLTVLNNLSRNKYELHLCIIKNKGNYFHLLRSDVHTHLLNCKSFLLSFRKIYKCIIEIDPDIVFGFLSFVTVYLGFIKKFFLPEKKIIARETGLPSTRRIFFSNNNKILCSIAYKMMNAIVCQCVYQEKELISYYHVSSQRLVKIPNPTDCSYYIKHTFNTKNRSEINLVSVGALEKRKNHQSAIQAMHLCHDKNLFLHIYGAGSLQKELFLQIQRLHLQDQVKLHGFSPELPAKLAQYDVFVLTSLFEPCSNALLEAQALGLPAIVYDCPGANTEIIQDGVTGFLIELNNTEKLARCISDKKYLTLDRNLIHQYIMQNYSVEKSIIQYEKLLDCFHK